MARADRLLGRLTVAARPGPVLRLAPPRWARVLGGAGGRRDPAGDDQADDAPAHTWSPAPPAWAARPRAFWGSGQVLTLERARRELALSVIAVRLEARSAVSRLHQILGTASSAALEDAVLTVSHLLHLLGVAQDRAGDLSVTRAYALGMPPGAGAVPAVTWRPQAIEEAGEIGQQVRSGRPVIMNVAGLAEADAKRLADFAAGFIFGIGGIIKRISGETVLLLPPDDLLPRNDPRDARYLAELHGALPPATESVREALHFVMELSPPASGLRWEGSLATRIRGYAGTIRALALPLNLASADLTGATASVDDLTGAIWTASTVWPSAGIAAQVRSTSDELSPGTYQIRGGAGPATAGLFL